MNYVLIVQAGGKSKNNIYSFPRTKIFLLSLFQTEINSLLFIYLNQHNFQNLEKSEKSNSDLDACCKKLTM